MKKILTTEIFYPRIMTLHGNVDTLLDMEMQQLHNSIVCDVFQMCPFLGKL